MYFFFRDGDRLFSGYIGECGGGDVDDDGICFFGVWNVIRK